MKINLAVINEMTRERIEREHCEFKVGNRCTLTDTDCETSVDFCRLRREQNER